ncbi:MAG: FtsX-like permease family protein [Anaerohalosphaera sp.]|nr:FtsX-like permease family protein [Anaerohalosphaera sp.]
MYKVILPARYLFKRRIAILAILAVALCVFMVVVVMTVMRGLLQDFREKNHNFFGDCIVSSQSLVGFTYYEDFIKQLEEQDFVEAVSPVINAVGIMSMPGSDLNDAKTLTGIDPARHIKVTNFAETLHYRKSDPQKAFVPTYDPEKVGCVPGIDMVYLRNSSGGYSHGLEPMPIELKISCFPLTARGNLLNSGMGSPVNTKNFFYSDDSHSGIVKIDSNTVYLPFGRLQSLCGMGGKNPRASAIHIKFAKGFPVTNGTAKVTSLWKVFAKKYETQAATSSEQTYATLMDNVVVESWKGYRRSAIAPMEKEQAMMTLIFGMLGIITVFIILVVFYMMISSRSKDIGILKSVGISTTSVVGIFIVFAGFIGCIGTAIGMSAGCAMLVRINSIEDWLFDKYNWQLWDRSIYAIGDIPNKIEWQMLTIIGTCAVVACLVGAIIPSYQAARREIADTLRVDQL